MAALGINLVQASSIAFLSLLCNIDQATSQNPSIMVVIIL